MVSFNQSQLAAVSHTKGPMLVLAGPGSGKTLVITERTKRLILEQGVDPARILVVTLTKAAAKEMRERFFRLMGQRRFPVTFGTFHAVFFQVLKHAYGFHSGNIIREEQKFAFLREIITGMHLEYEDEAEFMGDLLGEISLVKNTGISLAHYYPKNCAKEVFEKVFQAYGSRMRERRLIDFDDRALGKEGAGHCGALRPGEGSLGEEEGQAVQFHLWESPREEGEAIIRQILKDSQNGRSYKECAVLFRTNTQPRLFMSQLMAYNIPFRTKDNIPNIYEHWIARDILAYIRLALGSRSRGDILQVMNRPKRYISRESLESGTVAFDAWADYFYAKGQPWVAERIEQLEGDLRVLSRVGPFAAINYIRMGMGYEGFLKEYAGYRRINEDSLFDVLDELQDSAREFKGYEGWFAHMEAYAAELKRQKQRQEQLEDCVSLATLHSSKGLEYPIVHILDVNEGLMPYKKAVLDTDLQEERRMFYVGATRAKECLYIHSVKKYNGKDAEVSRFLGEMKSQAPQQAGKACGSRGIGQASR